MKKIKLIIICLVLLSMSLCLIACSTTDPLVGKWKLVNGDLIYYFVLADNIEFFSDGRVIEDAYNEWGTWAVAGQGKLKITDSGGDVYMFDYSISNNQLSLRDSDGDVNVYRKG